MSKKKRGRNVWVIRVRGGFQAKLAGCSRALTRPSSMQGAIAVGRLFARKYGGDLIVQDPDGAIRTKETYRRDAFPRYGDTSDLYKEE